MIVLDGKSLGKKLRERLKKKVFKFQAEYGKKPGLAVLRVGDDKSSLIYVERKIKACKEAGFKSHELTYPHSVSFKNLAKDIKELNRAPEIHGILIQLPLPPHLKKEELLSLIKPEKDPDGLTLQNRGLLWSGRPKVIPCTALGIIKLLKHYLIPLIGKRAVVVGRSQIVGLPTVACLLQESATVTVCHSRTQHLGKITAQADIVVVAAGKQEFLSKKDFKKGAVVVDVGIHRMSENGKTALKGDVKPKDLENWLSALSPVPGGVGPMTIAMLLENTFSLAESTEKHIRND